MQMPPGPIGDHIILYCIALIMNLFLILSINTMMDFKFSKVKILICAMSAAVFNIATMELTTSESTVSFVAIVSLLYYVQVFILYLLFVRELKQVILAMVIFIIYAGLISAFTFIFVAIFISNYSEWVVKSTYNVILSKSAGTVSCCIAYIFIRYFKSKSNKGHGIGSKLFRFQLNKRVSKLVLINIAFLVLLLIPNYIMIEGSDIGIPGYMLVYDIILLFVIAIYGIVNLINSNEQELQKQQMETQQMYVQSIEATVDKLRSFKHNFANIIASIQGYAALDKKDELQKYLSDIQTEFAPLHNTDIINSNLKNMPELYGILLSKISYAEVNNVSFHIHIFTDSFKVTKLKSYDLCKILGVLIDNAIEAAIEYGENGNVSVIIDHSEGYTVTVTNTCKGGGIDAQKIYEKDYTTKENHMGIGLYEVDKILQRYKKQGKIALHTLCENDVMIQKLNVE